MTTAHRPRPRIRLMALTMAFLAPLALSACLSGFGLGSSPPAAAGPASPGPATVNATAAATMVSAYRQRRGLPPVRVDSKLMAIAARHAEKMAAANKMDHVLRGEGSFPRRLAAGGYDAAIAAENLAAGARNLDEAFDGWRRSRGHNANLLKRGVTELGIAVAYTPKGKFHNYWTLVLAAPDERQAGSGPGAAPAAVFAGSR